MPLTSHGITNFALHELVHPDILTMYSPQRIIHWLDIRWIKGWQWIRTQRGKPIYMNTCGFDSIGSGYPTHFQNRGLRLSGKGVIDTSQHPHGRAGDGDEFGTPNAELYEWILQPRVQTKLLEIGVTTIEHIEHTPTWIHLDCRNWGFNLHELQIVKP